MTAEYDPGDYDGEYRTEVARMATQLAEDLPDSVDYVSEAHRAAWRAYYDDPVTAQAQATFDARQAELLPMREAVQRLGEVWDQLRGRYNEVMTGARVQFQADAHTSVYRLTLALMEADRKVFGTDGVTDAERSDTPGG